MSSVKTQRIVCLLLALLFLFSTIGGIAYYILAVVDQQNQSAAITNQLKTQTSQSTTKLQGTKLANFQPISSVAALQTI